MGVADKAQETLCWFRSVAPEFPAAMTPTEPAGGGLQLNWGNDRAEHTAVFNPDGSMWVLAEEPGGDESFEAIAAPSPEAEQMLRAFYQYY